MLKSIVSCVLAVAALASAEPIPRDLESRADSTSSGNANFDRLPAQDHPVYPIGYYGGLYWTGIYAVNASDTSEGLIPKSLPNIASFGSVTADLPIISSVFQGTKVNSFQLSSLYFGCTDEAGRVPVACKVSVYTYDKLLNQLSYSPFYFAPQSNSTSKLVFADLSATPAGVSYARFVVKFVVGYRGLASIDNVKYSITTNGTTDAKLLVAS
ncbi:hypothetical protein PFICI_12018 [Pestalotiopsis fici W106-1]|uniref:Ubiquitin 3 binding protein But2 C-terminal domain-containing protein n=1 Tax=Pestalotiopsis fici (strain W106-1 / CGMCC3.15140) TaxID=1229662 RepID=W3WUU5_PESFW|nr:uncharacterized protein PFICI_12018 [Pestalotiopsis fici W106-1]ETS76631.1 hypothetical protein PFICI_12018 [Pestalotiopsis fici W106-1]